MIEIRKKYVKELKEAIAKLESDIEKIKKLLNKLV